MSSYTDPNHPEYKETLAKINKNRFGTGVDLIE